MKKNLTAMLLAALAVTALASCGDSSAKPQETEAPKTVETEAVTEELDALEARRLIDDGLPEKDWGGREFRICAYNGNTDWYILDETTGDVVDDAVYTRTQTVEERFNVKVTVVKDDSYSEVASYIKKIITAGEDACDIIALHVIENANLAQNDYLLNWYDVPYVDFSKPWWSSCNVTDLTYKDVCFVAIGDMCMNALTRTYCTFYNARIGADYDLGDVYEVVTDGKWTFDYVISITKDIYQDLNTDGQITDLEDLFGYCTSTRSAMDAYLWAFDNPIFTKAADGSMQFTYKSEKIGDMLTKIQNTFNHYDGIRASKEDMWGYGNDMFEEGKTLVANGCISNASSQFREMTDDYYILPYPKWDEAQANYKTMVDGSHEALSIPTSVPTANLEFIGMIMEAMNAETYKTVVPAYYDVALKVKGTRDERSIEMLDMIVDSRIFDFGYVYDGWKGVSFWFESLLSSNTNFETQWAKQEKSVMKHYNSVLEYFENYTANNK